MRTSISNVVYILSVITWLSELGEKENSCILLFSPFTHKLISLGIIFETQFLTFI